MGRELPMGRLPPPYPSLLLAAEFPRLKVSQFVGSQAEVVENELSQFTAGGRLAEVVSSDGINNVPRFATHCTADELNVLTEVERLPLRDKGPIVSESVSIGGGDDNRLFHVCVCYEFKDKILNK